MFAFHLLPAKICSHCVLLYVFFPHFTLDSFRPQNYFNRRFEMSSTVVIAYYYSILSRLHAAMEDMQWCDNLFLLPLCLLHWWLNTTISSPLMQCSIFIFHIHKAAVRKHSFSLLFPFQKQFYTVLKL